VSGAANEDLPPDQAPGTRTPEVEQPPEHEWIKFDHVSRSEAPPGEPAAPTR
jgi:hypothetical protein